MDLPATARGTDRDACERFVIEEARLLDDRRFRDWLALFTDDGAYWVPAERDQPTPHGRVSLFYDDRELMGNRIERLEHPLIHVQTPPSRTVHLVGSVTLEPMRSEPWLPPADLLVQSSVMMAESRLDQQRLFAARQWHWLRVVDGRLRIVLKRVDLVDCDGAFEAIALPI